MVDYERKREKREINRVRKSAKKFLAVGLTCLTLGLAGLADMIYVSNQIKDKHKNDSPIQVQPPMPGDFWAFRLYKEPGYSDLRAEFEVAGSFVFLPLGTILGILGLQRRKYNGNGHYVHQDRARN